MNNEFHSPEYCCGSIKPEQARKVVEGLNLYLANLNILFVKLHNIHWNVVGAGFFEMHKKTQELYEAISEQLDEVAERIKMLGCYPRASMQDYLEVATICELPSEDLNATCSAKIILEDFCTMLKLARKINEVAKDSEDDCTSGLLAEAICFYEKNLWFFSAFLTRC
ncbi:Dps family protein [Dendrosporobacter sp. 1207_IL3150]|uniref:Dps family protein n=1 Tax=Dendrosporobacter sp. 1207_IL3150 TaxID=3084054 RepID=UPI002FDACBA9